VGIVTAGMHHRHLLALVLLFGGRRKGQPWRFLDRQGVHVGAQRDRSPGLSSTKHPDNTSPRHPGTHLKLQIPQVVGYQLGCLSLLVAKLRMLVDLPAPLDHLRLDGGAAFPRQFLEVRSLSPCAC
jgi:hypothetical protein